MYTAPQLLVGDASFWHISCSSITRGFCSCLHCTADIHTTRAELISGKDGSSFLGLGSLLPGAARRHAGGGSVFAAALVARPVAGRRARARHQLPVDDRICLALPCEARSSDGRVDGVRGVLLRAEVADVALLAVRVPVAKFPGNSRQACDTKRVFPCRAKSIGKKLARAGAWENPFFFHASTRRTRRNEAELDK